MIGKNGVRGGKVTRWFRVTRSIPIPYGPFLFCPVICCLADFHSSTWFARTTLEDTWVQSREDPFHMGGPFLTHALYKFSKVQSENIKARQSTVYQSSTCLDLSSLQKQKFTWISLFLNLYIRSLAISLFFSLCSMIHCYFSIFLTQFLYLFHMLILSLILFFL